MRRSVQGNHSVLTHLSWRIMLLGHPTPAAVYSRPFLACSNYFAFLSLTYQIIHSITGEKPYIWHHHTKQQQTSRIAKDNTLLACRFAGKYVLTWEATSAQAALHIQRKLNPLLRARVVQGQRPKTPLKVAPKATGSVLRPWQAGGSSDAGSWWFRLCSLPHSSKDAAMHPADADSVLVLWWQMVFNTGNSSTATSYYPIFFPAAQKCNRWPSHTTQS